MVKIKPNYFKDFLKKSNIQPPDLLVHYLEKSRMGKIAYKFTYFVSLRVIHLSFIKDY